MITSVAKLQQFQIILLSNYLTFETYIKWLSRVASEPWNLRPQYMAVGVDLLNSA